MTLSGTRAQTKSFAQVSRVCTRAERRNPAQRRVTARSIPYQASSQCPAKTRSQRTMHKGTTGTQGEGKRERRKKSSG